MKLGNKERLVLLKILEKIEVLEMATDGTIDDFLHDKLKQHAAGMAFLNMGELTNHLSQEFKTANKDIPFHRMKGMRNVVAHEYDVLDFAKIWRTIKEDIPVLKIKITELID